MPELPEVETVRMQLEKYVVGKTISEIASYHKKSLLGDPTTVTGKKILAAKRLGKMIVLDVEGKIDIGIHLKMSGQLLYQKLDKIKRNKNSSTHNLQLTTNNSTLHKHTRVIIGFKSGDQLIFNDQRIFGWVRIMSGDELKGMKYVINLGPEPWDISDTQFYKQLQAKKKAIKVVLTDQDIISGVGNIYANDALWEAGVKPTRGSNTLKPAEVRLLRSSIVKVLKEGIKYGGSTGQDGKYINLEGNQGSYQNHFRVYDRKGLSCLRSDGGKIVKITLGGRGTYFCPVCQK